MGHPNGRIVDNLRFSHVSRAVAYYIEGLNAKVPSYCRNGRFDALWLANIEPYNQMASIS